MSFKVRLRLVHGSFTDLSIIKVCFRNREQESRLRTAWRAEMFQKGRKAKRSKKKKILSLIIVVAVTGTSGAVVYRKVRRPMAAATETDNVQQTEVKNRSTALCGMTRWDNVKEKADSVERNLLTGKTKTLIIGIIKITWQMGDY